MTRTGKTRREGAADSRAVIDIGSNTVRLVVYGGPPRAPAILHNEKVTARLGKGMAETGMLGAKPQAAALAALARYRAFLDYAGVEQVDVVATAAARDAQNGPEFLARVRDLGFDVRLLSGEEEALTSAGGVAWAFPGARGIVADLGGGSLELTDIADGTCTHGVSLPLGTLRLAALREKGAQPFARLIGRMLAAEHWQAEPGATLYLVGGSLRAFARHAMIVGDWPIDDPHGFTIDAGAALKLAQAAARRTPETPAVLPGLSSSRIASLPDAAALLAVLIAKLKPARLVFSSWGLREGVLFAGAEPRLAALDPLIAGISDFAARRGVSAASAAMIAGWTLAANPRGAISPERLRLAATMLSLASARIEPNLRIDTGIQWALRKRWIGVDAGERALLAAAILANAGKLELPPALSRLAPQERLHEAQAWGLATRLCRRFSGAAPAVIAGSSLAVDGEDLRLQVAPEFAVLVNDGVQRDLKAVAAHLGLRPVLRKKDRQISEPR
jgi:exopolyphosphatase/guanosine-5'-triphosphate,3'-diphosphate pyrophosphatase